MRVRATLTLRNDALLKAIEAKGFLWQGRPSLALCAERSGVSYHYLIKLSRLQFGDVPSEIVDGLAIFLGVPPEALVPPEVAEQNLKASATLTQDVDPVILLQASSTPRLIPSPVEASEASELVRIALDAMRPREREAVERHTAGETFQSIADDFGVSIERARQIHMKGVKRGREQIERATSDWRYESKEAAVKAAIGAHRGAASANASGETTVRHPSGPEEHPC